MNSLKIQWNHFTYKDTFCCSESTSHSWKVKAHYTILLMGITLVISIPPNPMDSQSSYDIYFVLWLHLNNFSKLFWSLRSYTTEEEDSQLDLPEVLSLTGIIHECVLQEFISLQIMNSWNSSWGTVHEYYDVPAASFDQFHSRIVVCNNDDDVQIPWYT
jgi:hypothetical protein